MLEFNFQEKLMLSKGKIFLTFTSYSIFGDPTYAYVVTDNPTIEELSSKLKKIPYISYADCGDIIMIGKGAPDDEKREQALQLAKQKYS